MDTKTIILISIFTIFTCVSLAAMIKSFKLESENKSKTQKITASTIAFIISLIADITTIANNIDEMYVRHNPITSTTIATTTEPTTEPTTGSTTTSTTQTTTKKEATTESTVRTTTILNDSTTYISHQFREYESIPYTKSFYAPTTGTYGFRLDIDSVKYSYQVIVYNSKDVEVLSRRYYDSNDNEISCELIGGEKYTIQIEPTEGTPKADIIIYYPAQPKQ